MIMFYALIACNVLMVVVFIAFFNRLPPRIPLFYSKIWGEDQLAESWMIFLLPIFMTIFVIVNTFIKNKFFPDNHYVKKLFEYVNWSIILFFSFVFIKIFLTVI